MTRTLFALIVSSLYALSAQAQQEVTVDYVFEGNINLSDIRSTLQFAEFTDGRDTDNPKLITSAALGDASDGYQAQAPLAELIRDAFVQGFSKGGVDMPADAEMTVTGEIVGSDAAIVDRGGVESIQLTLRTRIELQEGNRTLYETTLFGRGTVPVEEGIVAAVRSSLDRMVRELSRDDYFMIELQ